MGSLRFLKSVSGGWKGRILSSESHPAPEETEQGPQSGLFLRLQGQWQAGSWKFKFRFNCVTLFYSTCFVHMSPSPHMANLKTIQWGVGQDITYPFCRWKNGDAKKLGDKAMVFSLVTYGCESWTIKKAECQRIDAFELWCWRRLLRVLGLQGDQTSQS